MLSKAFFLLFILFLIFEDKVENKQKFTNANNTSNSQLRVAIAYWGMTRSTRYVYETHEKNLFNVLDDAEIEYTVFMHTWRTEKNFVWGDSVDIPIVENEYEFLNPSVYVIDNEIEFLNGPTFNLSMYWYESEWKRAGENEWRPDLVHNLVCGLESLRRLTRLLRDASFYDLVIYVRPDLRIDTPLELNWLHVVHSASTIGNQSVIALPNFGHYGGLNDRFAIMPWQDCEKYGSRLSHMADYRKKIGFITAEKYLKYVVSTSFDDVIEIPFRFTIIRPDGKEWKW